MVWIEQPRKESEDFGCCYKWACRPAQCGVHSCLSRSGRPSDLDGKLDCFSWITLDMSKHNPTVAVLDLCCHPWSGNEVLILNRSLPRGQRKTKSRVNEVVTLKLCPRRITGHDTETSPLLSLSPELNSSRSLILFFSSLLLEESLFLL